MVEAHRMTEYMAEGLAAIQLHMGQALDLELPEQYSTCQVVGLRIVLLLKMVAVGMHGMMYPQQVALAVAAVAANPMEGEAV